MPHQRLTSRALGLTLLLSALWGGNPVAIKVGLADCPPLRLGLLRFVLGGAVVLLVAGLSRQSLRVHAREWRALLGLGLLFSTQLALMNLGQDLTSAGHATVILSTYPLWTSTFAHFFIPGDRLTLGRVLGALVAYSGILLVLERNLDSGASTTLLGDGLLVLSSVLLGARQIVLARSSQTISVTKLLLAQAVCGSLSFALGSTLFESEPTHWTPSLSVALLYQGVVIAGVAFFFQAWLLERFPPSRVTTVYLTQPLFGVLLSAWILSESVGPELLTGALLVVGGSFFVQRR